jgi:putative transcriptional regulator
VGKIPGINHLHAIRALEKAGPGGVQMKAAAFEELLTSVRQAGEIRRGQRKSSRTTRFKPADVKALRNDLGQSQVEFALMIGVSVATLRNWEQGR